MKAKYFNPYTDFGFKKLFGEEANKDLLADFLNQLLPAKHKIVELTFKNPEQLGRLNLERKAVFDIHCKNEKGDSFIVEMQKAKLKFFKDRAVFYMTFPIREQAEKGDWDGNGLLDLRDYAALQRCFGHSDPPCLAAFDRAGVCGIIDPADYTVFADALQP